MFVEAGSFNRVWGNLKSAVCESCRMEQYLVTNMRYVGVLSCCAGVCCGRGTTGGHMRTGTLAGCMQTVGWMTSDLNIRSVCLRMFVCVPLSN